MINTLMGEQWETKEQTNCYEVLKRTIEQRLYTPTKACSLVRRKEVSRKLAH